MLWFPNEARYWALKLQMDTNLPPLMPDEDKNFRGYVLLDFRKWWRHVKTIYCNKFYIEKFYISKHVLYTVCQVLYIFYQVLCIS